jgi:tRNA-2-methylthio-N6-dimethylallyladenosine synthase
MSDVLIDTIAATENICKFIHLPVQSGSDRILELMNRSYDTTHYLGLIRKIRERMPEAVLSTDIITGFPGETEEDHRLTLELMRNVGYDGAFTFKYSPREHAPSYKMGDTVSDDVKTRRIGEILDLQRAITDRKNATCVGQTLEVLVEGMSKKSADQWQGKTDGNKMVTFPGGRVAPGDYAGVRIERANTATLFGTVVDSNRVAI